MNILYVQYLGDYVGTFVETSNPASNVVKRLPEILPGHEGSVYSCNLPAVETLEHTIAVPVTDI